MHISGATFAYPKVSNADRAVLARALTADVAVSDVYVLSTCLRVEIAILGDLDRLTAVVDELLPNDRAEPDYREGEAALVHLYRVAAGLDSPIVGEREILTQFRKALRNAEGRGLNGIFARALQGAVASARTVHEALPKRAQDSIGAVAAAEVAGHKQVAVFGAGTIAMGVVNHLLLEPDPPAITVVARTPEKVDLPGVDAWPFERAAEALQTMPAVVSATSAERRLLPTDQLADLITSRTEPITIIDMAMPPDFAPPAGAAVTYLDIDDLARRAEPQPRVAEADAMACRAAVDMFHRTHSHGDLAPMIGSMMANADQLVAEAVAKFGKRLTSEEDLDVLRQTAHTVARKLMAGPVGYLNGTDIADDTLEAFAAAFGVDA